MTSAPISRHRRPSGWRQSRGWSPRWATKTKPRESTPTPTTRSSVIAAGSRGQPATGWRRERAESVNEAARSAFTGMEKLGQPRETAEPPRHTRGSDESAGPNDAGNFCHDHLGGRQERSNLRVVVGEHEVVVGCHEEATLAHFAHVEHLGQRCVVAKG